MSALSSVPDKAEGYPGEGENITKPTESWALLEGILLKVNSSIAVKSFVLNNFIASQHFLVLVMGQREEVGDGCDVMAFRHLIAAGLKIAAGAETGLAWA